jgi:carboxyl-terminal processing protease
MFKLAPSFAAAAVGSILTLVATAVFPAAVSSHTYAVPSASRASGYKSLKLFDEVFETVRADYVDKPSDSKLITSSIKGMLSGLDPHSSYMDAQSFHDIQAETDGKFGGVGMVITKADGVFKVISSVDGSPAAQAAILGGDDIVEVDGKSTQGLTLMQVAEELRGPAGTKVRIELVRKNDKTPIDLTLTRQIIKLHPVHYSVEGNDVGYIRISEFDGLATDELKSAIRNLSRQIPRDQLKGYILDLRNDPGGLLDQAVSVSGSFLSGGEVVSIRGRGSAEQHFDVRGRDLLHGSPMIVLINGGSASASEIVAGALQDHKRATIVGSQSFGKGSVQTIIPLGNGNGAVRLTTGRYYLPSGRSIQAEGITPDITVLQPPQAGMNQPAPSISEATLQGHLKSDGPEKSGSQTFIPPDQKQDRALQRALSLLRGTTVDAAFPPGQRQAAR